MRLRDFSVIAQGGSTPRLDANRSFFPMYEAIRLWLKDNKVEAPFGKIAICLMLDSPRKAPSVTPSVSGVVCAYVGVGSDEIAERAKDPVWVSDTICTSLDAISELHEWSAPGLRAFAAQLRAENPPCAYRFEKLTKTSKGVRCEAWFVADIHGSEVRVRFSNDGKMLGELAVKKKSGPLFLEDEFPLSTAVVVDSAYVLRDRAGIELARVPLP